MLISCGADMGMNFANTTKFDVRKANPSGGRVGEPMDEIKRQFGITTPRPAVHLQGDGVASINMLSIGSSSIPATHSLDESAFGHKEDVSRALTFHENCLRSA
jgi:hypothetical protein